MSDGELSEKQENALELVLQGKNDSEVAEIVGVSRQSVNTWRNHNEFFICELHKRREMIREVHMLGINYLTTKAIRVMDEMMESDDPKARADAAKYVLGISGLKGHAKPNQESSKEKIIEEFLGEVLGAAAKEIEEKYKK